MNISNEVVTVQTQDVSDKSIRLTGNAPGISEELLNPFVGHLHEMVLVEPTHIFVIEMRRDRKDGLTRNFAGFGGMFETTGGVGTFFSLAGKVRAQLDGQVLRKDVGGSDVGIF